MHITKWSFGSLQQILSNNVPALLIKDLVYIAIMKLHRYSRVFFGIDISCRYKVVKWLKKKFDSHKCAEDFYSSRRDLSLCVSLFDFREGAVFIVET